MKKIIATILVLVLPLTLVGCSSIFTTKYKVQFKNKDKIVKEIEVEKNSLLNDFTDIEEEAHDLVGWYKNLEDEETRWKFTIDKVTDHLILHAKWQLNADYVTVENIKLRGSLLVFDEVEDSTYIININDFAVDVSDPQIDLSSYQDKLIAENDITIKVVKEGKKSFDKVVKINYRKGLEQEILNVDFEEISKVGYAEQEITYKNYKFISVQSLVGSSDNDSKNGKKSLRFNVDGIFEFKTPIKDFSKLSFNLAKYKASGDNLSNLSVYIKTNLNTDWTLHKTYTSSEEFVKHEITLDDFMAKNFTEIYFKFVKDNAEGARINLDDIIISNKAESEYTLVADEETDNLEELSAYYKSAQGLKGEELVNELNFILSTNLTGITYSKIKEVLEFADADLEDPSNVIGIYNRVLYRANWGTNSLWHREHVWPNSRLGMDRVKENDINQGSDPHNLRAINPSVNSSRSNRYFTEKTNSNNTLGHTGAKNEYYPGDLDIGDVSRINMYMAVRYKDILKLTDSPKLLGGNAYTKEAAYMGKLSLMNNWHETDKVDKFEKNRNEVIFSYQGNRNPFIDHPHLFEEVYNYFVEQDALLLLNLDLTINFNIDYGQFKKENNNF